MQRATRDADMGGGQYEERALPSPPLGMPVDTQAASVPPGGPAMSQLPVSPQTRTSGAQRPDYLATAASPTYDRWQSPARGWTPDSPGTSAAPVAPYTGGTMGTLGASRGYASPSVAYGEGSPYTGLAGPSPPRSPFHPEDLTLPAQPPSERSTPGPGDQPPSYQAGRPEPDVVSLTMVTRQAQGPPPEGALDLTGRHLIGAAMAMPACYSVKSAIIMHEWTWALAQPDAPDGEKQGCLMYCLLANGTACTCEVTVNTLVILSNELQMQLESERQQVSEGTRRVEELRMKLLQGDMRTAHDYSLRLLKDIVQPFDLRLCGNLVQESTRAASLLEGKDGVLLFGDTGAGKSTLVHFLKGSEFVLDAAGKPVPDPSCQVARDLCHIRVSAGTTSETRFVAAVTIKFKDVDPAGLLDSTNTPGKGSIQVLDAPGHGDTRGSELAVANEIGIVNAAKAARTLRVVLVFSESNVGSRFERVPKLLKALAECTHDIAEDVQCVRFVWNGYSPAQLQNYVPKIISSLLENPNADYKGDGAVMALLEEAENQMKPKNRKKTPAGAQGVDLRKHAVSAEGYDPDGKELARAGLVSYIYGNKKATPMEVPGDVFVFAASPETTTAVNKQLAVFRELVSNQTRKFPSAEAVSKVKYVLGELKFTAEQIPLTALGECLSACREEVNSRLQTLCEEACGELERLCAPQELMQVEGVEGVKRTMEFLMGAEHELCALMTTEEDCLGFFNKIRGTVQHQAKTMVSAIVAAADGTAQVERGRLQKLCCLGSVFPSLCGRDLEDVRAALIRRVEHEDDGLLQNLERKMALVSADSLETDGGFPEPEACADEIVAVVSQLRHMIDGIGEIDAATWALGTGRDQAATPGSRPLGHAEAPAEPIQTQDVYSARCRDVLTRQLDDTTQALVKAVTGKRVLEGRQLEQCHFRLSYLRALARQGAFVENVSAQDWLLTFEIAADDVIKEATNTIGKLFKAVGWKAFGDIEAHMARIYPICQGLGPAMKQRTVDIWPPAVESLSGYLHNTKQSLEGDVKEFLDGNTGVNFKRLSEGLAALRGAEWMNTYKPGVVDQVVGDTTEEILRRLKGKADSVHLQTMEQDQLSEFSRQRLEKAKAVLDHLEEVQPMETGIKGLEAVRTGFEADFSSVLSRGLRVVFTLYTDGLTRANALDSILQEYENVLQQKQDSAEEEAKEVLTSRAFGPFESTDEVDEKLTTLEVELSRLLSDKDKAMDAMSKAGEDLNPLQNDNAAYENERDKLAGSTDKPKQLREFLSKRGYDNLDILESQLKEAKENADKAEQELELINGALQEAATQKTELEELKQRYSQKLQELKAKAREGAAGWLQEQCCAERLRASTVTELKELSRSLRSQCDKLVDDPTREKRAGRTEFDYATANDACEYLRICTSLDLGARLELDYPDLVQVAQKAFDSALKLQLERLTSTVRSCVKDAQAFNPKRRRTLETEAASGASDAVGGGMETPDHLATNLRLALGTLEQVERLHKPLFVAFEGLHVGSSTSLQGEMNMELVRLYNRLEQDLDHFLSAQQMGEHEAKVQVAQSFANVCDPRFQHYEPRPKAAADDAGSFHALFREHHSKARAVVSEALSKDTLKMLFPSEKNKQDDTLIFHEIDKVHSASGLASQASYGKLMQFYERSLEAQMREHLIRLSMLDSVLDPESLMVANDLQQFLSRLTGASGVQIMFKSLWLQPKGRKTMDSRIMEWVEEVKMTLASKAYSWLKNITSLAKALQFKRAGDKYAALKKLLNTLQQHGGGLIHAVEAAEIPRSHGLLDEDDRSGDGALPVQANISRLVSKVGDKITNKLTAAITKYETMNLSEFLDDPPCDLVDRLKEARESNDNIHASLGQLEKVIQKKFREELDNVRELCDPNSDKFREAKRAIDTLPDKLKRKLTADLEDIKKDAEEQSIEAKKTASELLAGKVNVRAVVGWFRTNGNKPQHKAGKTFICEHLREQASSIKDRTETCLTGHKPETVVEEIRELFQWEKLDEFAPALGLIRKQISDIVEVQVVQKVKQLTSLLRKYQQCLSVGSNVPEVVGTSIHRIFQDVVVLLPLMRLMALPEAADKDAAPNASTGRDETDSAGRDGPATVSKTSQDARVLALQEFEAAFESCCAQVEAKITKGMDTLDVTCINLALAVIDRLNARAQPVVANDESVVPTLTASVESYCRERGVKDILGAVPKVDVDRTKSRLDDWIEHHASQLSDVELLNSKTTGPSKTNQTQKDFYTKVNASLRCLVTVVPSLPASSVGDHAKLMEHAKKVVAGFTEKVQDLFRNADKRTDPKFTPSGEQLTELGEWIDNLVAIGRTVTALGDKVKRCSRTKAAMSDHLIERLKRCINAILSEATQSVTQDKPQIDKAADLFIRVKTIGERVKPLRRNVELAMEEKFRDIKRQRGVGAGHIESLHVALESHVDPVGQIIVEEHSAFKGGQIFRFNERCQGIEYVLDRLRAAPASLNIDELKKQHDEVMKVWRQVVEKNLKANSDMGSRSALARGNIRNTCATLGPLSKNREGRIKWPAKNRREVPGLLANLFALWTLSHVEHYFDAEGVDKATQERYLLAPHAGQVVCLLRMFGVGLKETGGLLQNHLVQLKTGEGKSVVMANWELFQLLNIEEQVHYGTFDRLCEQVINSDGEIRQMVNELVMHNKKPSGPTSATEVIRVVIVDEVDVLFSRDFYGQVYVPASVLVDDTVRALAMYIWESRDQDLSFATVKDSPAYKACIQRFGDWSQLIKEAVGEMLMDVNRFDTPAYIVQNDQIGYKQLDGIVFNMSHRYCTMFAYCHEHEVTGKISKASRDRNIGVRVRCGNFSYGEIPNYFQCIMGVTGTLDSLSRHEQKIIKSPPFNVSHETFIPTVFGGSPPIFSPGSEESRDLFIQDRAHFAVALADQIAKRRYKAGDVQQPRAVLVFFADAEKLQSVLEDHAMDSIRDSIAVLTEELSDDEKQDRVKQASYKHAITFATAAFGRGTDFICRDKTVLNNGGVHVIQAFVASSLSEEVQVRGRTARQGQPGSYSLLLVQEDLEKLDIDLATLNATPFEPSAAVGMVPGSGAPPPYSQQVSSGALGRKFKYITDCRNKCYDTQYADETAHIAELRKEHQEAQKFLAKLRAGKGQYVRNFLVERNIGPGMDVLSRTICLMDATGSMGHLLRKAKHTVKVVHARLCDILKEHSFSSGVFEMQFVVYRNYNSPRERILQSSPWSNQPGDLEDFMATIEPEGGWGNEAVEVGLWHCCEEIQKVDAIKQVLLIGDAPANSPEEVKNKRAGWRIGRGYGEEYWKADPRFAIPTTADEQLHRLAGLNVPVHAYWVREGAKPFFQTVAGKTGGQAGSLDVNAEAGKEMLTNLLSKSILRTLDESGALVQAYNKRYGGAVHL